MLEVKNSYRSWSQGLGESRDIYEVEDVEVGIVSETLEVLECSEEHIRSVEELSQVNGRTVRTTH